ncbi:ribonuclease P protein component [Streptomyces sp. NP160]|uniref:ribonuclease P protein component n=1 Tax=Streptomyces sp. NP160 TaxID=2586637 RepID=UPI00111AAA0D|nr:ribonuclease P protein component [Streptomyces sp. NP160]TNM69039.1 ribonuclease P protein component [Streptomyces sp. NP160]
MLPAPHRLRRPADFSAVVRRGRRAGRRHLVLHLLEPTGPEEAAAPVRVGFVVSKAVGGSVVRNRVERRLRHLVAAQLGALPPGARAVVRANPAAAAARSDVLGRDLASAVRKLVPEVGEVP